MVVECKKTQCVATPILLVERGRQLQHSCTNHNQVASTFWKRRYCFSAGCSAHHSGQCHPVRKEMSVMGQIGRLWIVFRFCSRIFSCLLQTLGSRYHLSLWLLFMVRFTVQHQSNQSIRIQFNHAIPLAIPYQSTIQYHWHPWAEELCSPEIWPVFHSLAKVLQTHVFHPPL